MDIAKCLVQKDNPTPRWNCKFLQGHGGAIALSNRWDPLIDVSIENQQDLDHAAEMAIKRERHSRIALEKAMKNNLPYTTIFKLCRSWEEMKCRAHTQRQKYEKQMKSKRSRFINSLLAKCKPKDFHQQVKQLQGKSHRCQIPTPCFNKKKDSLVIDPIEILNERALYSSELAADPSNISKNQIHWIGKRSVTANTDPLWINYED
ncbi:hypothetical protein O181_064930 [Austropuccinia psidii MF-1]|uniref:Uncharacterized protein n=1 Tax=Austropuccinia psidii MF-1 TaxID=1389203 RepID=A0A9Q3EU45_9BASI|nr:hypothetical protein [Austropuccinia psidii MF-1]